MHDSTSETTVDDVCWFENSVPISFALLRNFNLNNKRCLKKKRNNRIMLAHTHTHTIKRRKAIDMHKVYDHTGTYTQCSNNNAMRFFSCFSFSVYDIRI